MVLGVYRTICIIWKIELVLFCEKSVIIKKGRGARVLTNVSQGHVETTGAHQGSFNVVTSAYLTVAFFVQDCEGLIDKNSKITYKGFSNRTWCGDVWKTPDEMSVGDSLNLNRSRYKPNPDCAENAHTDVSACGEWFRADLAQ